MATYQIRVLTSATLPDTSGEAFFEPASIVQPAGDLTPQLVARFIKTGAHRNIGTNFTVPQNYVGTPKVIIVWTTTATAGNAVWTASCTYITAGETLDPAAYTEAAAATTAAPGTTQLAVITTLTFTAASIAAGDLVQMGFGRNGASASDTMAADGIVYAVLFQYTDT